VINNILVVDDEPRHLRNLAIMIRGLRPSYNVLEATNGRSAIEIIEKHPVELVITDIKMPMIDGLTMIEKLNQICPGLTIIILSGYAHFEYAQKALKLGAFDFILKPVNEEKINDLLCKAEQKIELEMSEKIEKENIKKHQLFLWFTDEGTELRNSDIDKMCAHAAYGMVLTTDFDFMAVFPNNQDVAKLKSKLDIEMKKTLKSFGESVSFLSDNSSNQMITILLSKKEVDPSSLEKALNELLRYIDGNFGVRLTIGIGNGHSDLPDGLRDSFRESQNALELKFYNSNDRLVFFSKMNFTTKACYVKNTEENQLIEAMRQNDQEKSIAIIKDIIKRIVSSGYPNPFRLKYAIIDLLIDIMKQLIPDDELDSLIKESTTSINKCRSCEDLIASVEDILDKILGFYGDKNKKINPITIQCQKFIEENYMYDLSLDELANLFSFNPSYFSSFFKKAFGVNFSEYLQKFRISKAKELLRDKRNKVYEVAELVGYRDVKYFNRVFKKEVGLSPDEYKRLEIKG